MGAPLALSLVVCAAIAVGLTAAPLPVHETVGHPSTSPRQYAARQLGSMLMVRPVRRQR